MAVAEPIEVGVEAAVAAARADAVLGPQVPRLAAEWDSHESWRVLDGSLVFADISGFTALSERLDPEEIRAFQNALFEMLAWEPGRGRARRADGASVPVLKHTRRSLT